MPAIDFRQIERAKTPILRPVQRGAFLPGILALPVLIDGVRHLYQPRAVLKKFQYIRRAEKLAAVLGRIAQRLEQAGRHQRRNVVRLAVEHPPRLFRRQAGGQLAQERQKPMLVFFHYSRKAVPPSNTSVAPKLQNRTSYLRYSQRLEPGNRELSRCHGAVPVCSASPSCPQ